MSALPVQTALPSSDCTALTVGSPSCHQEVELHEDAGCVRVFPHFLRFLYTCHIVLNAENVLPVLVLADKYNVVSLRQVCVHFACSHVIPRVQLKEVFHVWFQYATRGHHR